MSEREDMLRTALRKIYDCCDLCTDGLKAAKSALAGAQMEYPTFNHTRWDGHFDPCPVCIKLMDKQSLIELAESWKGSYTDAKEQLREEEKHVKQLLEALRLIEQDETEVEAPSAIARRARENPESFGR